MTPVVVLVLDDATSDREAIAAQMQKTGYECHAASSPKEAERLMSSRKVDLAVVNAETSDETGDGLSFAARGAERTEDTIWFVLSNQPDLQQFRRALRVPVRDYFVKPVNTDELLARSEQELRRQEGSSACSRQSEYNQLLVHELNNLLTPLVGMAQLLASATADGADKRFAQLGGGVYESALSAARFVDKLREVNSISLGRRATVLRRGNLVTLVQSVVGGLAPKAEADGIQIELLSHCDECEAEFDFDLMPRAVENLLRNAVEHVRATAAGEARWVRVELETIDRDALVSVRNGGSPVSHQLLERFFEPFNTDRLHKQGGTGLGTTYAKLVVEAHSGRIGVTSTEHAGTCVWFRIPQLKHTQEPHP